jgi:endo-1,4-beta-D-glucanase Y
MLTMIGTSSRRRVLGLGLSQFVASPLSAKDYAAARDAFKARFVASEGRVRDFASQDISRAEGQSWCGLLAARRGDGDTFRRLQGWTYSTPSVRPDALLAWRYRPGPNGGVDDLNNATDADLYHVHALLIAHRRRPDQGYLDLALRVSRTIEARDSRLLRDRCLLLRRAAGFEFASHREINASYDAFATLDAQGVAFPGRDWADVEQDGEVLVVTARFGHGAIRAASQPYRGQPRGGSCGRCRRLGRSPPVRASPRSRASCSLGGQVDADHRPGRMRRRRVPFTTLC